MKKAKRNGKKHIPWFCQVVEAETLRWPAGTSPRSSVAVRRGRLGRQGGARPGAAGANARSHTGCGATAAGAALPRRTAVKPGSHGRHHCGVACCWRQRCPRRSSPCVSWAPARYQPWRGPWLDQQTAATGPRAGRGGAGAAARTPAPSAATTGGGPRGAPLGRARPGTSRALPGPRAASPSPGRPEEACRATSPGVRAGGERAAPGCCWHGLGRRRNNLTMPEQPLTTHCKTT